MHVDDVVVVVVQVGSRRQRGCNVDFPPNSEIWTLLQEASQLSPVKATVVQLSSDLLALNMVDTNSRRSVCNKSEFSETLTA